jgi:Tol biopolymer transport system component
MELWTSDRDGSKATPLTDFRGSFIGYPQWAPDSRRIVFFANPEGYYNLYTAEAEGGSVRRLSTETTNDLFPAWSRDGKWIYFTSYRLQGMEVWRMPSDGGPATQLTRKGGTCPQESPDQKWIYFMKAQRRSPLWRMPSGGGEETRVPNIMVCSTNWRITSGGIYFTDEDRSPDRTTIRYADLKTGNVRDLLDTTRPIFNGLDISPDKRWLTWSQFGRHNSDLMLVENFR